MAGSPGERSLKETPTWAVALVCAVMVLVSAAMEHGIHILGKWFQTRHKKAMSEALEKLKAELMLLGFISLLLTAGQGQISKICIPAKAGNIMLPCKLKNATESNTDSRRRFLSYGEEAVRRRMLVSSTADYCSQYKDRVPLISQYGIHQLHIFIFVLAVFHVLYSVVTMALGRAKVNPSRFRFTHQTSFVKRHVGLSSTPGVRWIVAFFRQFFGSVTKVDYLTMRHGFINPSIVVHGNHLTGVTACPFQVLLLVGMKLEIVIMEMAREIQDRTSVIKGAPIVEPSNKYFWFNRPQWILFLIHLTLFEVVRADFCLPTFLTDCLCLLTNQNAFQMAHFLWTLSTFGLRSCFFDNMGLGFDKSYCGDSSSVLMQLHYFPALRISHT
ncbi:MLO protein, partial [Ananas comosus]